MIPSATQDHDQPSVLGKVANIIRKEDFEAKLPRFPAELESLG